MPQHSPLCGGCNRASAALFGGDRPIFVSARQMVRAPLNVSETVARQGTGATIKPYTSKDLGLITRKHSVNPSLHVGRAVSPRPSLGSAMGTRTCGHRGRDVRPHYDVSAV